MSEQPTSEHLLQCQIPLEWQIQLETIAQRTGQSIEQVIYQAIGRYLGQPADQATLQSPEIAPDEDEIEDEPDEILTGFLESEEFQEQVRQTSEAGRSSDPSLYEEIENEPDEILYDFLES